MTDVCVLCRAAKVVVHLPEDGGAADEEVVPFDRLAYDDFLHNPMRAER